MRRAIARKRRSIQGRKPPLLERCGWARGDFAERMGGRGGGEGEDEEWQELLQGWRRGVEDGSLALLALAVCGTLASEGGLKSYYNVSSSSLPRLFGCGYLKCPWRPVELTPGYISEAKRFADDDDDAGLSKSRR